MACLDAAAGIEVEGIAPKKTHADAVAIRVAHLIANGMGGYDWSRIDLIVAWLGVEDIAGLLWRLEAIKKHACSGPQEWPSPPSP